MAESLSRVGRVVPETVYRPDQIVSIPVYRQTGATHLLDSEGNIIGTEEHPLSVVEVGETIGGIDHVSHDNTLTGDGSAYPLSVVSLYTPRAISIQGTSTTKVSATPASFDGSVNTSITNFEILELDGLKSKVKLRRTLTPDDSPPSQSLAEGELYVELASSVPRVWVGVPTSIDASGRRLVSSKIASETLPLAVSSGGTGSETPTSALLALGGAPLESPTLTGSPSAPTPNLGDLSSRLATTEFVARSFAPIISPTFEGAPTAPTTTPNDNSSRIATTQYVKSQGFVTGGPYLSMTGGTLTGPLTLSGDPTTPLGATTKRYVDLSFAPLSSPALTGVPSAPTPPAPTNTTQIATTEFVKAQNYLTDNQPITISGDVSGQGTTSIPVILPPINPNPGTFQGLTVNSKGLVTGAQNQGYATTASVSATYAPKASPALTGTPTAPTPAPLTSNTQIATTQFVRTGTGTNNEAAAGQVGEYIQKTVLQEQAILAVSGTSVDVATIDLGPGDWEITGQVWLNPVGAIQAMAQTILSRMAVWTHTVSQTETPTPLGSLTSMSGMSYSPASGFPPILNTGRMRLLIDAVTTVYLGSTIIFTGPGPLSLYGYIGARRIR